MSLLTRKKKLNILLVEPPYRVSYLPTGLQRIATYHLKRNDNITFINSHPKQHFSKINTPDHFDKIYITSVFTFDGDIVVNVTKYLKRLFPKTKIVVGGIFVTLMPDYFEKQTGIKPWIGIHPKFENQVPDYSMFPKTSQVLATTTRGCIRNCEFCGVRLFEPKFMVKPEWEKQVYAGYETGARHICFGDNNFIANAWSHKKRVINLVKSLDKVTVDFNQGLDCRIFRERDAKLLSQINIPTLRFAFDGMHEDGYFQKAVKLAQKYKTGKVITSFVLYNFNDTPEDVWYRLNEILKSKTHAFGMRYVPLDALNRSSYVGKHWTRKTLKNFIRLLSLWTGGSGTLSFRANREDDFARIGRTAEEFVEKINSDDVNQTYYAKVRHSKRALRTGLGLIDKTDMKLYKPKVIKKKISSEPGIKIKKYR